MKTNPEHDKKMAELTIDTIYPMYLKKIEKKGRSKDELHQVIQWLTGFDEEKVNQLVNEKLTFKEFFSQAQLNPNAKLIKGSICGYKVEEIETPLTQQIRYLDKLVDELSKGKAMDKILRS